MLVDGRSAHVEISGTAEEGTEGRNKGAGVDRATPITSLSTAHMRLARAPASVSSSLARPVIYITPFTFLKRGPYRSPPPTCSHAEPLAILHQ